MDLESMIRAQRIMCLKKYIEDYTSPLVELVESIKFTLLPHVNHAHSPSDHHWLFFFTMFTSGLITGASRRLKPVIKCYLFLSFFQCLVSRAPLSAVTESLS